MKSRCVVTLKKGREKPVLVGHPWIFSGAVKSIEGYGEAGDLCSVFDNMGRFLASGYVNKSSQITVRVLAAGAAAEALAIDSAFFIRRLEGALQLRESLFGSSFVRGDRTAFRVVNAEGDYLPGLIVDRYARGLVVQALTAGMQRQKGPIIDGLRTLLAPSFIYERFDNHMAKAEGLSAGVASNACLHGSLVNPIEIDEHGARFQVDVEAGHKTGFYLDQRKNRWILREISAGMTVLNCFSYTGAFGIQALLGGALRTHNVELSDKVLETATHNAALNGIDPELFTTTKADVFKFLREDTFLHDIVVLDPPKFAASRRELPGALRGYKDINLHGLKKVRAGGFLMTFSCSGQVSEELFQKVVFGAAVDAGRSVQIIRRLHADVDHPVNIAHREGQYLKGLLLRVE
ncbi:MAG: class I SAM-dependent rRNA methyltransferase [Spirochaetaceae bacterium]|nr:MAG: class I SAM-dependent rRNA methyltransferase [Spirochaetaceae bacterium]